MADMFSALQQSFSLIKLTLRITLFKTVQPKELIRRFL
jgi:hypothetical protein